VFIKQVNTKLKRTSDRESEGCLNPRITFFDDGTGEPRSMTQASVGSIHHTIHRLHRKQSKHKIVKFTEMMMIRDCMCV